MRGKEDIEKNHKEYYETHMKAETERLKNLVHWYQFKLNEIRESPVDDRLQTLKKLYRCSEKNKHLGVTITRAGVINAVFFFLSLFENMQLTNQFHLNVTFLNLYFKDTLLRPTAVPAPYGGT